MSVRDLLWGCPICRAPGTLRPHGRRERCTNCLTRFHRSRGSSILAEGKTTREERTAREWLELLGPAVPPPPGPDGVILGPEAVRVKITERQKPLRFAGELLGWVEVYGPARAGTMTLREDGLRFRAVDGEMSHWTPDQLTGVQPASSSLQLGLHGRMASVKFVEGSVRLWTRTLTDVLHRYYRRIGRDILELQPSIRTCPLRRTPV